MPDLTNGGMNDVMGTVIGVAVSLLVLSVLAPVALDEFFAANTSTWGASTVSIWDVTPVIAILAVMLGFIALAMKR